MEEGVTLSAPTNGLEHCPDSEAILQATAESYRTIFELASDAIFVHELETGAILDANRKACEMHGCTLEELKILGVSGISDGHPPFEGASAFKYMQLAAAGEPQRFEWLVRRKTGERFWVEVSLNRVRILGEDRILASVRNIDERKQFEAALEHARSELEQRVLKRTAEVMNRTAELMQAEQRFRAIVEASPTPLLLSRVEDGIILYANDRLEQLIGVEPGSLLGKKTVDFYFDPEERAAVMMAVQRQGYLKDFELRIRRADGTPRWVSLSVQRMDFNGAPALATALIDITERKEAEVALRSSEETYRGLFDNLTELVYIQALDGTFVNVNEAVVRTYGYAREEIIGQTPALLADPDRVDVNATMDAFTRAVAGEPQRFDWWGRRKDGSIFPKEVAINRSTYFGQDVVIAVARDISERIEAEAALRRSEDYFRRLIENTSDLISIMDAEGIVRYSSPSTIRILGYTPEELEGHNAFEFVAPEDVAPTLARWQILTDKPGTPITAEFRFCHKDGSWRILEAIGTTLSPDSAADGIVVNSRDITERKRHADELEQARQEAERAREQASHYAESLERELEFGRQIQQGLFPASLPQRPGWAFAVFFCPVWQVAGDFYDVFELPTGRIALLIADVSGKGVGAALFMTLFQSHLRASAERASAVIGRTIPNDEAILYEAISATNNYITRVHRHAHMFASVFFGLLDPMTGTLRYVNAGHEPPIVVGREGHVQRLAPTGAALGLMPDTAFDVRCVTLAPGEHLLAYTDGVTEARNEDREFYSEERLLELLSEPASSAEELVERIHQSVRNFQGEAASADDLTLLALHRSST